MQIKVTGIHTAKDRIDAAIADGLEKAIRLHADKIKGEMYTGFLRASLMYHCGRRVDTRRNGKSHIIRQNNNAG